MEEMKLYEQFKIGELSIEELTQGQKVRFLIMLRQEQKTTKSLEETIMKDLLEDDMFEKTDVEGIAVSKKTRPTISLIAGVDKTKIMELYPDICTKQNVLHQEKLSEKVWNYLKEQPEAVEEVISVDAKKLHMVTKDYTEQKITTYIEVKGL